MTDSHQTPVFPCSYRQAARGLGGGLLPCLSILPVPIFPVPAMQTSTRPRKSLSPRMKYYGRLDWPELLIVVAVAGSLIATSLYMALYIAQ